MNTAIARKKPATTAFLFRCDDTITPDCDMVSIHTNGTLYWNSATNGNWVSEYATTSHTIVEGGVVRCYITGTGASTIIYCYDDGVLIDAGSGYTFGGDSGSDTGLYIGVY